MSRVLIFSVIILTLIFLLAAAFFYWPNRNSLREEFSPENTQEVYTANLTNPWSIYTIPFGLSKYDDDDRYGIPSYFFSGILLSEVKINDDSATIMLGIPNSDSKIDRVVVNVFPTVDLDKRSLMYGIYTIRSNKLQETTEYKSSWNNESRSFTSEEFASILKNYQGKQVAVKVLTASNFNETELYYDKIMSSSPECMDDDKCSQIYSSFKKGLPYTVEFVSKAKNSEYMSTLVVWLSDVYVQE